MDKSNINIKNKKAWHDYFIDEEYIAGMVLKGSEIKSIRSGKVNLAEAYCAFIDNELYVINMHISEYIYGTHVNHEPKTDRKLLLNRREIKKLLIKLKERGYTLIPLNLFINDKGLAKLRVGLARGKKTYDKRESLKEKDQKREIDRSR
ncbi:MAG: SsrA-binding protein SmpB [Bacteroidales bacterium]|nr:SsrA-binding protein SmpB [Bacteroidales bacterium]